MAQAEDALGIQFDEVPLGSDACTWAEECSVPKGDYGGVSAGRQLLQGAEVGCLLGCEL